MDVGRFLSDSGLLFEINVAVLHPKGLGLQLGNDGALELVDQRAEAGGLVYEREEFLAEKEKLRAYAASNRVFDRIRERQRLLGFVLQARPPRARGGGDGQEPGGGAPSGGAGGER
jgi:hypothetical protein